MVVTRSGKNGTAEDVDKDGSSKAGEELKKDDTVLSVNEKRILRTVFISLVIDLLAFTVILPLLPSLLDYYGTKEVLNLVK